MPDRRRITRQPRGSGPTPGATSRRCSTPPPRSSSPRASTRRCATSRPGRASGWARSTATSRRGRTSSSPSTGTRSRPAPRPVRPCWRAAPPRTPRWRDWIDLFVDFLVTKHGLAAALRSDNAGFEALHAYFLDRLVPVCAQLLDAAADAGEIRSDVGAYELMRGVGNLCIGADSDPRYDARRWSGSSSRDCADRGDRRRTGRRWPRWSIGRSSGERADAPGG